MARTTRERDSDPAVSPTAPSRRHGAWFAVLAIATLLAVRLPLPWMGAAIVLVIAADVQGVLTARAIGREGRPMALKAWCICGIALISVIGLGATATLALYPLTYQRQQCLQGANTGVAAAACQSEFDRRLARLQDRLIGG